MIAASATVKLTDANVRRYFAVWLLWIRAG